MLVKMKKLILLELYEVTFDAVSVYLEKSFSLPGAVTNILKSVKRL